MTTDCENLDEYLAHDLPGEKAVRFERHLPLCEACREALDEQLWIDNLLRSPTRLDIEVLPSELVQLTRKSLVSRRRRSGRLAACGLAAAATLLVALGWWQLNRQADDSVAPGAGRNESSANAHVPVAAPRAAFVGAANVIALPIESHHPDVTIVRIYPTYRPLNDNQTVAAEPNAETGSSWYNYSNGG